MLTDCGPTNELYETLSSDFGEFPISKSMSNIYTVDTLGRPLGSISGDLLVWYNQKEKTISIVFEEDDLSCLLVAGHQVESYK